MCQQYWSSKQDHVGIMQMVETQQKLLASCSQMMTQYSHNQHSHAADTMLKLAINPKTTSAQGDHSPTLLDRVPTHLLTKNQGLFQNFPRPQ